MKRAPLTYRRRPWSNEKIARIREIERNFHVLAFGEESTRVNFELTIEERHCYLARMRELARQNGVPQSHRAMDLTDLARLRGFEGGSSCKCLQMRART